MSYQEHRNLQFDFFERLCNGLCCVDSKDACDFGRFPYIPASLDTFKSALKVVLRLLERTDAKKLTFLDAGCGIGDKVWIAQTLGYAAKGIELCNDSIRIGRIALGKSSIIKANLLTYKGYDKFDVIYLFRPMCNGVLESEFEHRLVQYSCDDVVIVSAGDNILHHQLVDDGQLIRIDRRRSFEGKLNSKDMENAYGFNIYVKPKFYEKLEAKILA